MKQVVFHRLAVQELIEAATYYEAERTNLGHEFLDEIERVVRFVKQFPDAAPALRGGLRTLIVARFPYSLHYRALADGTLRILAVAHHRRKPDYWRDRDSR